MSERKPDCQKRKHPELVLKRLWASQVTGIMGLSVHTPSTISSLTPRYF